GTDAFTGALARAAGENVGSYDYSIGTLTAGGNYELSLATGSSFAITKKAITITPTANQKKVYGEVNPTYTFTVSPALVTGDNFSGTLTRAVGENIGSYLIQQGDLAAGPNYETTFSTGILFEITKRPISVTVTPDQFKVYGEEDPDLVYQIGQMGLVNGDTFTGKLSRDMGENVGQYPIKLGTLKISGNYELTYVGNYFNIAARNLTIMAAGVDKMYDGTTVAQVKLTDNRLPSDQLTLSYTSANFVSPNIGNNIKIEVVGLNITGLHAHNYSIVYPDISTLASITKRTVSVRANDVEKVYGEADPVLTYTVSPELVNGDSFTGSLSRIAGENVGQFRISKGDLAINSNYIIDFEGAQLTIKPKPILITPNSITKIYGDSDPVLTFTHQSLLNNDNITGNLVREVGEDVGNYKINLGTLKAPENYLLSIQPAYLTIEKAILIAKANDMTMCEGANLPNFSISYTGFKRGDNEGVLIQPGMVNTNATKNSPAGVYNLTPSGVQALNYSVEYKNGLLTITKTDPVKITANTDLKVKAGTTITLTATGGVSYTWDNAHGILSGQNSATLIVAPTQNTTYTVNAVNANGCLITASIQIEIIKENTENDPTKDPIELVKGTNVITPNGDGINDNLVIKNIELFPNNEIIIFDLAGRVVYRKKGYDNSWAGTLNGIPLAKGTYYYIIDFGDNKTKKKGFVSIVRN
ncbi:MAG: gliding motility-associated C-terminal domain-containing protein, partial [Pedobacter sp.]